MKLALKWFLPITLTAMGLAWVSEQVALLLGFDPPPQDLVKLFTDPNIAWQIKAKYAALAVLAAPVIEEVVFRMGLFNLCPARLRYRLRRNLCGGARACRHVRAALVPRSGVRMALLEEREDRIVDALPLPLQSDKLLALPYCRN